MAEFEQLALFPHVSQKQLTPDNNLLKINGDMGTFKDNMQAPIHSWFRYPAGYSYKFVNVIFDHFGIQTGDWIYDPFSGTGTTLVCAKQRGIHGYGVEAHSFVHWIADVKLQWNYEFNQLRNDLEPLFKRAQRFVREHIETVKIENVFPELIYKCYHLQDLKELYLLREFILHEVIDYDVQQLLKLALTDNLRNAAAAGTGWPYIAPNKNTGDKPAKGAANLFEKRAWKMYSDLWEINRSTSSKAEIINVLGDSRTQQKLENEQIKLALTSPPYLNNYDYADRTRLETYFWGITQSWRDITEMYRNHLMVAATTQIVRRDYVVETALTSEIQAIAPDVYDTIQDAVLQLADLRLQKGGKKDYDLMVALYFNDILLVIQETYRVLRRGGYFCVVLGDSAPYGVHIQTEELIGKLGLAIGFSHYEYQQLRTRGGKWKDNPQRHTVPLREGVVILTR